jgi:integrase
LEAVTSEDVLKYRQELEAGDRAPLTINLTIKRVLRRAFKIAMDEGLIVRNPCATVRSIRDIGKIEKGTFTPEQIAKLVEHAEGDWKGLILAGYFTGGRLSDLARLKWSNVDLKEKTITFVQKKVEGKSPKARVKIRFRFTQLWRITFFRDQSVIPRTHRYSGSFMISRVPAKAGSAWRSSGSWTGPGLLQVFSGSAKASRVDQSRRSVFIVCATASIRRWQIPESAKNCE